MPCLTLHDYRKLQQSPYLDCSPSPEQKRLRRKASRADLAARPIDAGSGGGPGTRVKLAQSSPPPQLHPSPLLRAFPSTPQPHQSATSPSLSSSITTASSSPAYTPLPAETWPPGHWTGSGGFELAEPIRVKRKYPNFTPAKRLPHHDGSGSGWRIYAAIGHGIGDQVSTGLDSIGSAKGIGSGDSGRGTAEVSLKLQLQAKRGRSVRFAGISPESDFAIEATETSEAKEATGDSSFSLSKFKFPAPPSSKGWAGTLGKSRSDATILSKANKHTTAGHFYEHTPPTSPATLHYRGASFDLVNPHASLFLVRQKVLASTLRRPDADPSTGQSRYRNAGRN